MILRWNSCSVYCISSFTSSIFLRRFIKTQYVFKRRVHMPSLQRQWAIPRDLGMLDAYVPPSRNNLPSLWKAPVQRLRLGWRWFYHLMMGWFQRKLFQENIRPTKIDFKQLQVMAGKCYEKVNQAYANGNIKEIDSLCGPTYAEMLKSNIAKRPTELRLEWMLHRMIKQPKLVSFTQAQVELNSNKYLVQAIYKIYSEQSLTTFMDGLKKKGSPKVLTEYYVFQHKTWVLPHKWYIWGKTTEASPDSIKVKIWQNDGKMIRKNYRYENK